MLNETDLLTFNQAVALANSGRKSAANEIIEELIRTNLTDVNLYLWYAFTSENFSKAYNAVQLAHRYEPNNPSVAQAESWLSTQFGEYRHSQNPTTLTNNATATVTNPNATASRFKLNKLSPKLRDKVQATLKPDEEVKWLGRPSFLHGTLNIFDISAVLMGLLAFGSGIILLAGVLNTHDYYSYREAGTFTAWGLRLTIIGVFLLLGFFVALIIRLSTVYILTDRRAIIAKDAMGIYSTVASYTRANVKTYNTYVKEKWGGYGDLIFATQVTRYSNRDPSRAYEYRRRSLFSSRGLFGGDDVSKAIGSDGTMGIAEIGFTGIPNIKQVYSLFMETFDTTVVVET